MCSLNGAGAPGSQERTKNTGTAQDQMLSSGRDLSTQIYRTELAQMTRISALSGDGTMLFKSHGSYGVMSQFHFMLTFNRCLGALSMAWAMLRGSILGSLELRGIAWNCIRNRNRMSG
jgi:hypothetical protein